MPRFTVKASGRTPEAVLRQVTAQLAEQMCDAVCKTLGLDGPVVDIDRKELEAQQIREALRLGRTGGDAAAMIGMSVRTFYRRMKEYGIRKGE